jgi:hypothetical protein
LGLSALGFVDWETFRVRHGSHSLPRNACCCDLEIKPMILWLYAVVLIFASLVVVIVAWIAEMKDRILDFRVSALVRFES